MSNLTYTQIRDAIKETWGCNDKIAYLATRYYLGLEDLDKLVNPVNYNVKPLLTVTEAKIIQNSR